MKMQLALTRIKKCAMSEDNNIIVNNAELSAENTVKHIRESETALFPHKAGYTTLSIQQWYKPTGKSASRFILPAEKTTVLNTEKACSDIFPKS